MLGVLVMLWQIVPHNISAWPRYSKHAHISLQMTTIFPWVWWWNIPTCCHKSCNLRPWSGLVYYGWDYYHYFPSSSSLVQDESKSLFMSGLPTPRFQSCLTEKNNATREQITNRLGYNFDQSSKVNMFQFTGKTTSILWKSWSSACQETPLVLWLFDPYKSHWQILKCL